jgi:hypothetical protein
VNQEGTVNFNATKIGTETLTYSTTFSSNLGASFVYNGNTYVSGNSFTVSEGASSGKIVYTTNGTANTSFSTSANGFTHADSFNATVNSIGFSLTATPQATTIYKTESTNLNFNITESGGASSGYKLKYEFLSGTAIIKNSGGTVLSENTDHVISIGSFNWVLLGNTVNNVSVKVTATNNSGASEVKTISLINVKATDFTFTATPASNSVNINSSIGIAYALTKLGSQTVNYTMSYTNSGTGTFVYNGTTYTAGQNINVTEGSFTGTYIPTANPGTHNLVFTLTDVTNSNSKNETVSFSVEDIDVQFSWGNKTGSANNYCGPGPGGETKYRKQFTRVFSINNNSSVDIDEFEIYNNDTNVLISTINDILSNSSRPVGYNVWGSCTIGTSSGEPGFNAKVRYKINGVWSDYEIVNL